MRGMQVSRLVLGLLSLSLLVAGSALGATNAVTTKPVITLQPVGKLDVAVLTRVKQHVEKQLFVAVALAPASVPAAGGPAGEAKRFGVASNVMTYTVCLVAVGKPGEARGTVFPKEKVAVLNVEAYSELNPAAGPLDAQEIIARRIEKESLRALVNMIGVPPCPLAQCCLWPAQTFKQIDEKGRGLCPPCARKADKLMTAQSIPRIYPGKPKPAAQKP